MTVSIEPSSEPEFWVGTGGVVACEVGAFLTVPESKAADPCRVVTGVLGFGGEPALGKPRAERQART